LVRRGFSGAIRSEDLPVLVILVLTWVGTFIRLCSPLAKHNRCYDAVGMRIGSPEVLRIPDNRGLSLWTSSHNASHTEIESHFACNSLTEMAKSGAVWHYPTTEVFLNQKKPELPLAKPISGVFHLP